MHGHVQHLHISLMPDIRHAARRTAAFDASAYMARGKGGEERGGASIGERTSRRGADLPASRQSPSGQRHHHGRVGCVGGLRLRGGGMRQGTRLKREGGKEGAGTRGTPGRPGRTAARSSSSSGGGSSSSGGGGGSSSSSGGCGGGSGVYDGQSLMPRATARADELREPVSSRYRSLCT
eukprot:242424-Chlamydomonas_euryale.AAC.6